MFGPTRPIIYRQLWCWCVLLNVTTLPVLSIWRRWYRHLPIVFISYIGLSLYIFGNCVKQSYNHSHFSIRHENLACKHEPAWDRSFQSTGFRLTPEVWELAGIKFVSKEAQNLTLLPPFWTVLSSQAVFFVTSFHPRDFVHGLRLYKLMSGFHASVFSWKLSPVTPTSEKFEIISVRKKFWWAHNIYTTEVSDSVYCWLSLDWS